MAPIINFKESIVPFGIIIVFYWIVLFNPHIAHYDTYDNGHYSFTTVVFILIIVASIKQAFLHNGCIIINRIDILFTLYLFITILSNVSFSSGLSLNESLINFLIVSSLYYVFRSEFHGQHLTIPLLCISLCYLLEIVVIYFQAADQSFMPQAFLLNLKGTLENSGLLAGFIVCLSPLLMCSIDALTPKRIGEVLKGIFFVITILIVGLLQSRASFICFIPIGFYLVECRLKTGIISNINQLKNKRVVLVLTILGVITLCILLVQLKANSAFGRLLIWIVSTKNILSHPFLGVGYGNFAVNYSEWQGLFFKENGHASAFSKLADINSVAFNEILQITIETGILGLGVFAAIIYRVFKLKPREDPYRKINTCLKLCISGILIFSLFSYPLHSLPIYVLFIFAMAAVSSLGNGKKIQTRLPRAVFLGFIALIIVVCVNFIQIFSAKNDAVRSWNSARNNMDYSTDNLQIYETAYPFLKENGLFLYEYGVVLFDKKRYEEAVAILREGRTKRIFVNSFLYEGMAYQELNNLSKAEYTFRKVSDILPNRFKSKNHLFHIYLLQKDTTRALSLAKAILKMPIKVQSEDVNAIRSELQKFVAYRSSMSLTAD